MNFGIYHLDELWHVLKIRNSSPSLLVASCDHHKAISYLPDRFSAYPNVGIKSNYNYMIFSYKSICKKCIEKHNLTKADIIQHIINIKLGVKIPD